MARVFDVSTMAYYRFGAIKDSFLRDDFRDQTAHIRETTYNTDTEIRLPEIKQATTINPFCDTLQKSDLQQIPYFDNWDSGMVPVPALSQNQAKFDYTFSLWLKNDGGHAFTTNALDGRDSYHFFRLEESFALWFDSLSSFRVYIYAEQNYYETSSTSVFLPLH